jgi:hypothetical protein
VPWQGYKKKSLVIRTIAFEFMLPHNDGAGHRASARIESWNHAQDEFLWHDLLACPSLVQDVSSPRIIEQVGRHQPFEMPLIQDNHVV